MNESSSTLNSLDAKSLEFSATPSEPGPLCSICVKRDYALVRCCGNGHTVCSTCLFWIAEAHVVLVPSETCMCLVLPAIAGKKFHMMWNTSCLGTALLPKHLTTMCRQV